MQSRARRRSHVLAAVAAVAACAPVLDWRDVRPEGSGAVLLFPCRPDAQERSLVLAGSPVRLRLQACSAGGATWGLARADVADPARVGPALAALRAAAASNLGTTEGAALPWAVPGATPHPASGRLRLDGHLPDGQAVRMELGVFARGTQVFQASVLGAALPPEVGESFFGSIRFER